MNSIHDNGRRKENSNGRGPLCQSRKRCGLHASPAVIAEAFPQSGEGGCERSEQTDEGAGQQLLRFPTAA